MRKDGAIPETYADVDQATMYLLEENRHLHVIKFGNKNWAQLLCYNSKDRGVLQDADDIAVYIAKRKGASEIFDGIGSGGSIGGDAGNQREGTGSGYNNDHGDGPWAGYAHHVGLKYMKIGKKSSDRWKGSKVWSINQKVVYGVSKRNDVDKNKK